MAIFGGFGVAALTILVAKYVGAAKSKKHIVKAINMLREYVEKTMTHSERKQFILNRIQSFEDFVPDEDNLEEYRKFAKSIVDDISIYLNNQFQQVEKIATDVIDSIDYGFDSLANFLLQTLSLDTDEKKSDDDKKGEQEDT